MNAHLGRLAGAMASWCCVLLLSCCGTVSAAGPDPAATPSGGSTAQRGDPATALQSCLPGRWLHSHEEDSVGVTVYRDQSHRFPPSRGRTGFELRADGKAVYLGIAAADGLSRTPARWAIEGAEQVSLTLGTERLPSVVLHVLSCEPDKLTVRSS